MVAKKIFVFDDDAFVAEDLSEMLSTHSDLRSYVFSARRDLMAAATIEGCFPFAVILSYKAHDAELETDLMALSAQGALIVLMDGLAAEERVEGSGGWHKLRKPFTQDTVDELVARLVSAAATPVPQIDPLQTPLP